MPRWQNKWDKTHHFKIYTNAQNERLRVQDQPRYLGWGQKVEIGIFDSNHEPHGQSCGYRSLIQLFYGHEQKRKRGQSSQFFWAKLVVVFNNDITWRQSLNIYENKKNAVWGRNCALSRLKFDAVVEGDSWGWVHS